MTGEMLATQPSTAEQFDRYLRKYNDAATWLAEVLDGSMRTPFEYQFDGNELYAEDGGALGPIFADAIEDARRLQIENPELYFELPRRLEEQNEYHDMLKMMRGEAPNTMVVVSDFPEALKHATEDVGGYSVQRKTTMLRVLVKQDDRLKMYSQTLDGSDREALTAIYRYFNREPQAGELLGQRINIDLHADEQEALTDRLMGVYDRSLHAQYGGQWHAGRQEILRDTYSFVREQHDIVDYCVQQDVLGRMDQDDLFDVAALIAERFEAAKHPNIVFDVEPEQVIFDYMQHNALDHFMRSAGVAARAAGKTFSGCGISTNGRDAGEGLTEAGYGNQSQEGGQDKDDDEDEYGSLSFKCKYGHTNTRPRGKLISQCRVSTCLNSVAC